jgi:hypothetical protein
MHLPRQELYAENKGLGNVRAKRASETACRRRRTPKQVSARGVDPSREPEQTGTSVLVKLLIVSSEVPCGAYACHCRKRLCDLPCLCTA